MAWKKEVLRDLESLGSFVFYFVVASRSLIGMYWPFLWQAAGALVLSLLLWQLVKFATGIKASSHASNIILLMILVNAFYKDLLFGLFTVGLFGFVSYAHIKLRKHKKESLIAGALIGLVAGGIALWFSGLV